jgi:hypothetical protein
MQEIAQEMVGTYLADQPANVARLLPYAFAQPMDGQETALSMELQAQRTARMRAGECVSIALSGRYDPYVRNHWLLQ